MLIALMAIKQLSMQTANECYIAFDTGLTLVRAAGVLVRPESATGKATVYH